MSRVDAVHMALRKRGRKMWRGAYSLPMPSPLWDSIDAIKDSGIVLVIQPGGSIRDQEVVDACNEYKIAMVFTGIRCFKH